MKQRQSKINFRHRLAVLDKRRASLEAQRSSLLKKAEKGCLHADLVEAPSYDNGLGESYYNYSGIVPPYRVCRRCGLAEKGWDYRVLGPDNYGLPKLPRDEAEKFVLGWCRKEGQ